MAEWALLPSSLVDHVARFLTVPDQARMSATCKSWREAMADGLCRRCPAPSIWIILRDGLVEPFENGINEFASFSGWMRRSYFLSMPSEHVCIVGSSRGWIMLQNSHNRLQAFHPISRTIIMFPKTDMWIKKVVFVPQRRGSRGSGVRPALAIILRRRFFHLEELGLSLATVGDDDWTALPAPHGMHFLDIVADGGKLYALGNKNQVVIFNLDGEEPSSSTLKMAYGSHRPRMPDEYLYTKSIGVFSGELVIVRCWSGPPCPSGPIRRFEVSRLQKEKESRWKWVRTKDLGGHAIMYDYKGVIALPIGDHEELRANCVYSMDGGDGAISLSVTNLESKTVGMISHCIHSISSSIPLWFFP